jgi:DNA-binding transcriptional MerR regulator
VAEPLLPIGELARRTGVAITALRYYDELGLVRPEARASGQRRYAESAVRDVGVVLFLRDVGFSLAEIAELGAVRSGSDEWAALVERKVAELAEQERSLRVARSALEHARDCPAEDPTRCPRFWAIVDARLAGASVEDSHAVVH